VCHLCVACCFSLTPACAWYPTTSGLQMVVSLLELEGDCTRMSLVTCNHGVDDILMGAELDALVAIHPDRLEHHPVLSSPPPGWTGGSGWVSSADLAGALASAGSPARRMALVCGTDGFLETVCGDTIRLPAEHADQAPRKVQGPVRGLLRHLGYTAHEVTRM
jgi:ferredoxin-NADP reductase